MEFQLIIDPHKEESAVITAHEESELTEQIRQLVINYDAEKRLWGVWQDQLRLLHTDDIECITVLEGKTYAIDTQNRHYRLKQRLYALEDTLPASFIRINKSTLANEHRLDRFVTTFSGGVDAVFKCGYREYVSRRCLAQIKRRYDK